MHGGKEIVFAVVEDVVVNRHSRRNQLGYTAFHEFLGQFGVFELFANSHSLSGAHKFGQVGVEGVVREPGKLHVLCRSVGTARQGYSQYLGSGNGIVRKCLIKVAHAEQQYRIGMFLFHLEVLLHQRCFYNLFSHKSN